MISQKQRNNILSTTIKNEKYNLNSKNMSMLLFLIKTSPSFAINTFDKFQLLTNIKTNNVVFTNACDGGCISMIKICLRFSIDYRIICKGLDTSIQRNDYRSVQTILESNTSVVDLHAVILDCIKREQPEIVKLLIRNNKLDRIIDNLNTSITHNKISSKILNGHHFISIVKMIIAELMDTETIKISENFISAIAQYASEDMLIELLCDQRVRNLITKFFIKVICFKKLERVLVFMFTYKDIVERISYTSLYDISKVYNVSHVLPLI